MTAGVVPQEGRKSHAGYHMGMVVGIDNISPGKSTTKATIGGMRSYLQDLLDHLPVRNPAWHFKLFSPEAGTPFEVKPDANLELVTCPGVPSNRMLRAGYEQTMLPGVIRRHGVDVWIGTHNTLPLRAACREIVIAQSFQYFTQPDAYPWAQKRYLRTIVPLSFRRADLIIALSEVSKSEIVRRLNIPADRIVVIPHRVPEEVRVASLNGSGDAEVVRRLTGSEAPFVFSISALYPYKNHRRLIQAFAQIQPAFPKHRLVIGGAETWGLKKTDLADLAKSLGVGQNVLLIGRVAAHDLPALYRSAEAMAMPSLDETFGLSVLEAMHLGCPVVTSQASSMSETGGDAVVLVDPLSIDSIAQGLRSVLGQPLLRQEMRRKSVARAASFSTERMIGQLTEAIESVGPEEYRALRTVVKLEKP